jgi:DNA repair protein RecN (Recombination protein N)
MIERLYLKELLSFDEVTIEFDPRLIVLSGASGAGKSVLIQSILSSFGYGMADARVCEITLSKPTSLESKLYELDDELVIRSLKKDRSRFYLNDQNISKKSLKEIFSPYIHYLSVQDKSRFESGVLVKLLDDSILSHNQSYSNLLESYSSRYDIYRLKSLELTKMIDDQKRLVELVEFATYEIDKIKSINPKEGEDIELMRIKQQLSKIDKINDSLAKADGIFSMESSVQEVFRLLQKDDSYFTDAMNHLRADFEETQQLTEELLDIDVEEVLDRLEQISGLKNRYGSIEEALIYQKNRELELEGYQSIDSDRSILEEFLSTEQRELTIIATQISQMRILESHKLEEVLNGYLEDLKLSSISFIFDMCELCELGIDSVDLQLGGSTTTTLSGGEFNRLRLAILVVAMRSKSSGDGVIILDEIDANVSGDESIAIASMIAKLSSAYQVFAISHQAHLSAKANQHILVTKEGNISSAKVLNKDERVVEISRIIGGKNPDKEAVAFALKLL